MKHRGLSWKTKPIWSALRREMRSHAACGKQGDTLIFRGPLYSQGISATMGQVDLRRTGRPIGGSPRWAAAHLPSRYAGSSRRW